MATVTVNDKPVEIGNDKLNCIQAAERAGVEIPHYCWHPGLTVVASCRMCLVEVGDKKPDGTVAMQPKVVPGCQTLVKDGTVILTNSPKAVAAQASTLEGLLINHPLDCPVCDKAGECKLQDYSFEYGNSESRMIDQKNTPPNKPDISSKIALFTDRCILCSRCVRFTREVSGLAELQVVSRGDHSEIDVFPGHPLENKLSGNVVDLCPVGALGSKDFLYKQRVWFLKSTPSVCPHCSTGCSVHVDANKDIVFRLRARENPEAQGYFICDEGRWGYHHANDKSRIGRPLARRDGRLVPVLWNDWTKEVRRELAQVPADRTWGVISPFLTVEEAFLLARFLKGIHKSIRLAMGPIPVVGADDTYPKDRRGNPTQPVKFTIRAEKCPNRPGVEEVLLHFEKKIHVFGEVLAEAERGQVQGLFLSGGSPRPDYLAEADVARLARVGTLVAGDILPSPVLAYARFVYPATSFAEKDGTYVNHAGLAQLVHRAIKPPQEAKPELQLFSELLDRRGLVQAALVRAEVSEAIPFFAKLAGDLGAQGRRLALN